MSESKDELKIIDEILEILRKHKIKSYEAHSILQVTIMKIMLSSLKERSLIQVQEVADKTKRATIEFFIELGWK